MAQISTADFKTGMTVDLPEGLFQISDFQHVKPGKGGAFVRTTLKNVRTGAVLDRTFRAGEKMERAIIDKREMQYLYNDGHNYVFMNTDTYEQMEVSPETLGDTVNYLIESNNANLLMYGTEIIGVDMPAAVIMEIVETEPGVQGDRVSGARKPATVQTGLVVQVPLFVEQGEKIKVDTRSGEYLERAN
ncbi:MAG: elongation factor P [Acidimicrobiales bacterium]|nr:elongation factor P [Acidimicrobiales bacterium]